MRYKNCIESYAVLSGNEAIAQAAYEAGVTVASGYPGTPSSEILARFAEYPDVYAEWAPNEKVALEVALGASFAGARALMTTKHVGLNVAADPLFTSSYTGVRGGLVVINADDPSMHSSQNEQDNRHYARAAKLPMLEPCDAAEAKQFLKLAFQYSEQYDTPVLLRTTTRVSHVKSPVLIEDRQEAPIAPEIVRQPGKFVMLPANARRRRLDVETRMGNLRALAESCGINRIEWHDRKVGFITAGVSYLHVREAFPEASVLKLGMVWPLPADLIRQFAVEVEKLIIVEELDPFLETEIKALGIACLGKDLISPIGELNAASVRQAVLGKPPAEKIFAVGSLPPRPPALCPGCPHRGLFYVLSKMKCFVAGDIGCYTLGAAPPLSAMHTCVCMGAGIGIAHGFEKALGAEKTLGSVVAVIGDSTFFHSGITGLIDIAYNKGCSTVIILDNRTTGMTGHQEHPSTGSTLSGDKVVPIDIAAVCKAVGIDHVVTVDPNDIQATEDAIRRETNRPQPSVIIAKASCVLLPDMKRKADGNRYVSIIEKCAGCRACIRLGCPAVHWTARGSNAAASQGRSRRGFSRIVQSLCYGCGQCASLCKFGAITSKDTANE